MSHWLCWVNSSYACGLNREARLGKLHSALPAAGTKDKRVAYMALNYVGLLSKLEREFPKVESLNINFTIPQKMWQPLQHVAKKWGGDTIIHMHVAVWCIEYHHPGASTSATVLSFNSQHIPPAGICWHSDRGGDHLHTVTNTRQADWNTAPECLTQTALSHRQQHAYCRELLRPPK